MEKFLLQQKESAKKEKGVALLFVVLLTSVLFLVTMGISNIAYKELVFSLEARDSDLAFFAADTGIECGMYLFRKNPAMFSSTTSISLPSVGNPFTCKSTPLLINTNGGTGSADMALPIGKQCVDINVSIFLKPNPGTGTTPWIVSGVVQKYQKITARGYNTSIVSSGSTHCLPLTGVTATNLVSRVLQVNLNY